MLLFESSYVLGFVDSFVLYSLICASRRILFIYDGNIQKILQIICVLRWLVCFFSCMYCACVIDSF